MTKEPSHWDYVPTLNPWRLGQLMGAITAAGSRTNPAGANMMAKVIKLKNEVGRFVDSYPSFDCFVTQWRWLRLFLPLQVRLAVEQGLWNKGDPWRRLVAGFRPIDLGSNQSAPRGTAEAGPSGGGSGRSDKVAYSYPRPGAGKARK